MWLNYHHLLYFHEVARHGSVSAAARELGVSQPTVSTQLRELEAAVGEELFVREGRTMVLTDAGRVAFDYAREIFSLGREMLHAVNARRTGRLRGLAVGVADDVFSTLAHELVRPALRVEEPIRLAVRRMPADALPDAVRSRAVDVGLTHRDAAAAGVRVVRVGVSGVSFLASDRVVRAIRTPFPAMLADVPLFLPAAGMSLRVRLDAWFSSQRLRPKIVGEFDDLAVMKHLGQVGEAAFPVLTCIERAVTRLGRTQVLGRLPEDVSEPIQALVRADAGAHPGVAAILNGLQTDPPAGPDLAPWPGFGILRRAVRRARENARQTPAD
jgi:LysR family transcriptional activator of nhaA